MLAFPNDFQKELHLVAHSNQIDRQKFQLLKKSKYVLSGHFSFAV
jgi:hypothetical protein